MNNYKLRVIIISIQFNNYTSLSSSKPLILSNGQKRKVGN
jgi:hypothetical protein